MHADPQRTVTDSRAGKVTPAQQEIVDAVRARARAVTERFSRATYLERAADSGTTRDTW